MRLIKILFILAVLTIPILIPLLKEGFFLTDDGNSMVIRFSAFYETLRAGQFPVRFLPRLNFGYGYPVADFLYPLFMYVGVPIKALGFSFVDTIKIIFGLSFLSGTIFSFLWLRKFFDEQSALVGGIIYSYFPYHLFDLYKRGSIGEIISLGILPFILWQVERRNLFWGVLGIFLLILSHNTLAVLFIIFILLYAGLDIFIQKNRKQLVHYYAGTLILGLGLSSFFSMPAIFDLQYTIFQKTQVSDWRQYFSNFDLIGFSTTAVFSILTIFILNKKIDIKKHKLTLLMQIVGIISIFFAASPSLVLWNILPVSFIQFPFRFLSLTIVVSAFLGAAIISVLKEKQKIFVGITLLVLVFLSSKQFLAPLVFQNYSDTFYSTNQDSTTVKNEYMPKWVSTTPVKNPGQKVEIVQGKGQISNLFSNANKIKFNLDSQEKNLVAINTVYFPGWKVAVNGQAKAISYNNKYGIIQFEVEKGRHEIEAFFGETNFRLFADFISLTSFLVLIGLAFKKYV